MSEIDTEIGKVDKGRTVILRSYEFGAPVKAVALVGRTFVDKRDGARLKEIHIYGAGNRYAGTEYYPKSYPVKIEVQERPLNHIPAPGIVPNSVPFRYPPEP